MTVHRETWTKLAHDFDHDVTEARNLIDKVTAHLVTKEDFEEADPYGFLPVWTQQENGDFYCECILVDALYEDDRRVFWSTKPTEEQMRNVQWADVKSEEE